ncbi:MAG: prolyl oligopeptidase family serine peptidase [Myxococcota bacterium]
MITLLSTVLAADLAYQEPPDAIRRILDAQSPPVVYFSPDRQWMLEMDRPALRTLADLAEPEVKVAGLTLNPDTNGPAREYAFTGMRIGKLEKGADRTPELPGGAQIRNVDWHPDGTRFAWTNTTPTGIELWVTSVEGRSQRLLTGLNAVVGAPCDWLAGDDGLLCRVVPEGRGPAPERPRIPKGPKIDESLGRKAPARTFTNLLGDTHDEALFEHYLASDLVRVGLDGKKTVLQANQLIGGASPSPDGQWVLLTTYHRPWSYHVPLSRFPERTTVFRLDAPERAVELADLPLADDIPVKFGSVRKGRRTHAWRADAPATLWFVEALDDGDAGKEARERDVVSLLDAPFDGKPRELWRTELRFSDLTWGTGDLALAHEWWYDTRQIRTWRLGPDVGAEPELIWDRSYQDAYADPGTPVLRPNQYGRWVLLQQDGKLLLNGSGATPDGLYPFLDRFDLATKRSKRLWASQDPYYERVRAVLDASGKQLVTERQSATEPPNHFLRKGGKAKAITHFEDWAPQFAKVQKELVTYTRADGLELSATIYTPPGWKPADGPLPTVFWAYPREFKSRSDAGQVTSSDNTFSRPSGSSHLFLLLAGYAVVDDPTLPVLGEGDAEPNDTYVEQLVSGAKAAVDMAVAKGVTDPERTVIGGHSYGAFMTANLLAHSDLFAAGIARSGAYNRSLTPFGFQSEQRTYWDATDTYIEMSPFTHVPRIDEPLLLIHGASDPNPGTYPMQSERMFEALKGNGGRVRWVELPLEEHGYRARESIGHTLWEMIRWADTWAKGSGEDQ